MLVVLVVTAWSVSFAVSAPRGFATTTCSLEPASGTVSVTVASLGAVSVGPALEIHVDGSPCTSPDGVTATLSNAAAIVVTGGAGDDVLRVDLAGGAFGDVVWAVDLGGGEDTLAVRGTDDRDALTVGSAGFSFDGSGGSLVSVEAFVLRGLGGNDVLSAAGGDPETGALTSGSAVILGGSGNDRLEGGLGGDVFRGGPGGDLVTYLSHTAGITATLDGIANDGVTGEDFIRADVENLMGGLGDDVLAGNAGPNRLAGAPGSDVLGSGDGRDRLRGEQDDDRLDGGAGDDLLRGGFGEDVLEGGEGRDTLQGDGHSDTMTGGLGDDTFHARDGWVDSVVGGRGSDTAHVDADDEVTGCEVVDRAELWTSGVVDDPSIGRILAAQPHMGVYWLRPGRIPFRGSGPRSPDAS